MRAAFVYPNPRARLAADVVAGRAPDTNLWGQNHLGALGIEAYVHEPRLRRRERRSGLAHRLTWNVRELALPWELPRGDLAVTPLATIFPLAARVRRGPRVVLLSYHLCALHERAGTARRRLLEANVHAAAAVVCIAEAAREHLVDRLGADPQRTHLAPLGVDERFWTPARESRDGHVLAVGRDLARDYATLAAAAEGLDARVVAVAKRENVAGLRFPANVEVRLDVTPLEVRELYAGAACVALPIRAERPGLGTENSGTISLLEAMASARPVVLSERSYLRDYVTAGETALVVPPEDPAALREALASVLADAALAERLGAAARRRVEERHTSRLFAERLAAILRSVA
jgi:glycosyltransferase involved in cell wall biosynthesis